MSTNPARILRVPGGSLTEGAPADITIIAPDLRVRVKAADMRSRSKNTPFDGWELAAVSRPRSWAVERCS
jgi:dihydroorotase